MLQARCQIEVTIVAKILEKAVSYSRGLCTISLQKELILLWSVDV